MDSIEDIFELSAATISAESCYCLLAVVVVFCNQSRTQITQPNSDFFELLDGWLSSIVW